MHDCDLSRFCSCDCRDVSLLPVGVRRTRRSKQHLHLDRRPIKQNGPHSCGWECGPFCMCSVASTLEQQLQPELDLPAGRR